MELKISEFGVKLYHVPLKEVLIDSLHGSHTRFDLITVTVTTQDGLSGTGYTYTGGRGGYAIASLIQQDLRPYLVGACFEHPSQLTHRLDRTFHYVGRGGILSFALSAVDIALWDLYLKKQNLSLCCLQGRGPKPVRTYYGGIDLGYTEEQLLQSIRDAMAQGHTAVKIKVGKQDYHEDVRRIHAVRELIGPQATMMIDANMVWSVEQALQVCNEVKDCNLLWLEEPTNPDDILAYQTLSEKCPIPIAMGENLHTLFEHRHAIEITHIKYIQPDASNILGISGWLDVASLAAEHGLTVNPHGMQELHVNLMSAIDNAGWMEFHSFPIHEYATRPLQVVNGFVEPDQTPGIGVTFDWNKLAPYEVTLG